MDMTKSVLTHLHPDSTRESCCAQSHFLSADVKRRLDGRVWSAVKQFSLLDKIGEIGLDIEQQLDSHCTEI